MRGFVFGMVRKSLFKSLHMQGLGRHSREELIEFGRQDVEAIAGQLGSSDYFLGDKPSSIDASLYGALHNLIDCELDGPIEQFCMTHQNLIDYCARFKADILDQGETKQ
jgi:glutathione S-transferase